MNAIDLGSRPRVLFLESSADSLGEGHIFLDAPGYTFIFLIREAFLPKIPHTLPETPLHKGVVGVHALLDLHVVHMLKDSVFLMRRELIDELGIHLEAVTVLAI